MWILTLLFWCFVMWVVCVIGSKINMAWKYRKGWENRQLKELKKEVAICPPPKEFPDNYPYNF